MTSGRELYMPHKLAGTFQNTVRIGHLSSSKKPDIHVIFESVDVPKCCVTYTRRRMAIVQQFSHIVSAIAHNLKPMLGDHAQFPGARLYPGLNRWIPLHSTVEPQELGSFHELGFWPNETATG